MRGRVVLEPSLKGKVILQKAASPRTFLSLLLRTEGQQVFKRPLALPRLSASCSLCTGNSNPGPGVPDTVLSSSSSQGHASCITDRPPNPRGLAPEKFVSCQLKVPPRARDGRGTLFHSQAGGSSTLIHTGLPAAPLVQAQKRRTSSVSH